MSTVVGVRFRPAGKIYYFDPGDVPLNLRDAAVVETARGIEYGYVAVAPREVPDTDVVQPLKKVLRRATDADTQRLADLRARDREAMQIARRKIAERGLDMHLVEVESTFDGSKMTFQFTAEERVDFRELVKDLAAHFRTRIEMRQIGVRDEAKLLGGIGICGLTLCCSTWLTEFYPVSIRMAKDQNLSLNPAKISGVCGRLLCCLRYELNMAPEASAAGKVAERVARNVADDEDVLAESPATQAVGAAAQAAEMPVSRRGAPAPGDRGWARAVGMPGSSRPRAPRDAADRPSGRPADGPAQHQNRPGPRKTGPGSVAAGPREGAPPPALDASRPADSQGKPSEAAPVAGGTGSRRRRRRRSRQRRPSGGPGQPGAPGQPGGPGGPGDAGGDVR